MCHVADLMVYHYRAALSMLQIPDEVRYLVDEEADTTLTVQKHKNMIYKGNGR